MKLYFKQQTIAGFLVAIVVIATLAVYSYVNNQRSIDESNWVAHTNQVLYHIEQVHFIVSEMESAERGYSLTGNRAFLDSVPSSSNSIHRHVSDLQALTSDNPHQQLLIPKLSGLINDKIAFINMLIKARDHSLETAMALHESLQGKALMDSIGSVIRKMQALESELLVQRLHARQVSIRDFSYAYISLLIATAMILVFVFLSINRSLRARGVAEKLVIESANQVQDIYNNAPCGYHSLDPRGIIVEMNNTWLQWLGYTREEVIGKMKFEDIIASESVEKFNHNYTAFMSQGTVRDAEFEIVCKDRSSFFVMISGTAIYNDRGNYVKSRLTAFDYTELKNANDKVVIANRELEAFTYTVSHDLRAPLRSIDGYSRILYEEYGDKLDQEGTRILHIVMNNAKRMGQLIDDLLDFSRIGRKEIAKASVNTLQMVKNISDELLTTEKRPVDLHIGALDNAWADAQLFKQVWVNLISNALKYTMKNKQARVEVNSRQNAEEIIYCVRDNGAGFDMQYVHKLFGVFQRLHRAQDFEGTGVGLAIVHRIITRHGGRVWAEGKVNEGAAFYFSLPKPILTLNT